MEETRTLTCQCGQVQLAVAKSPIIVAECHCNSCRAAGLMLEALPRSTPVLEANSGTQYVLYRKDRISFTRGSELLREFRLSPDAKTRRVIASCCNTAMFVEFESGHWLSLYGHLWPAGTMPALDLRTMTSDLEDRSQLSANVPSGKRATAAFYAKLLGAWIAMGFKSPKIAVNGVVEA